MKAIILAAGYGTRLQKGLDKLKIDDKAKYERIKDSIEKKNPVTGSYEPKHKVLVELAGKPIIQYTVENIERAGIDQIFIVTNNKYFNDFEEWKKHYNEKNKIKIINDRTNSNEERLGTVGDFELVLEQEKINDNVIIIAGDNLLLIEVKDIVKYYNKKHKSIAVVYREKDRERLKKHGNAGFDENNRINFFEEKPENPRSEWICPAIYIYNSETLKLIKEMKFPDDKKDLIGNILVMLHKTVPFYAFTNEEKVRFDLGSIDDYDKADAYILSLKNN